MKRLIVHVGAPKTGTSSVQRFLFDNRADILADYRILYPVDSAAVGSGQGFGRVANGAILQPEYFNEPALREKFDNWFSYADTVILSEEVLFLADKVKMLRHLRNGKVDVIVLAYFRNAADYLTSLWMELNRFEIQFNAPGIEEFLKGREYLTSIGNLVSLMDDRPEFSYVFLPYRQNDSLRQLGKLLDIDVRAYFIESHNSSMSRMEADIKQLCQQEGWAYSDKINSFTITKIFSELKNGDRRSVIETIPDDLIKKVCQEHAPFLNHLMRLAGTSNVSFDDKLPSCFGKPREGYKPIDPSEYGKVQSLLKEFS